MEIIYFLLKATIIVCSILLIIYAVHKIELPSGVKIKDLSLEYYKMSLTLLSDSKKQAKLKEFRKNQKKRLSKNSNETTNIFVIDFKGSVYAKEVSKLTKEVDTILLSGNAKRDKVVIRLESPGGAVSGYGLGAAQLKRLRDAGFFVQVTVDNVAASGGYLMACVADEVIASEFSTIGSIGVIFQAPNFHKLLEKVGIEFEQLTAGKYKRTISTVKENTNEDREKFLEDLEKIHDTFKSHVKTFRPDIDIDSVSTGETWLGRDAISAGLIDKNMTSDTLLLSYAMYAKNRVIQLNYVKKESIGNKSTQFMASVIAQSTERFFTSLIDVSNKYR